MNAYTPSFTFDSPSDQPNELHHVRTAWISDVHLGTRASGAPQLLDFLRQYEFETLYIVGDLFDIWQMRRGIYWPQQHNDVIQKVLRKARKGARVIYIPGNHDEMISSFEGWYGNITVQKEAIHRHGGWTPHPCDSRTRARYGGAKCEVAGFLGDTGYQFLLSLNPLINFVRRRFGLGYWSLSAFAKNRVKDAVSFIGKYEAAVVKYAERYRVDGVLCGHIHNAAIRKLGRVTYYNCGDWVESHSALIEQFDGRIEIVRSTPNPAITIPFTPALVEV